VGVSVHETPTRRLVDHVRALSIATIPQPVVRHAKRVLADEIGVLLAANAGPSVQLAMRTFPMFGGPCSVVGQGTGATPEQAAFINGVGGHDIELDDNHCPSRTHAAAVIVPAALAAAEAVGGCPGGTLLSAVVAAYDVQVRVSKAMGVLRQFDRGFHPTSVCGTIGAAVAAGRIMELNAAQFEHCIALACSQSSGLLTWRDERWHMVKSFQTGIAARNGLYAAQLANNGFEGAPDPFTGRYNVLEPYGGPGPNVAALTDALGERFDIMETSLKRWACGHPTHAAIDAYLTLRDEHAFTWQEVEAIHCELPHGAVPVINDNPLLIANIQYVMALIAHEGRIRREFFADSDPWVSNPEIAQLRAKVTLIGDDGLHSRYPDKFGARVTVATSRGSWVQEYAEPRGAPSNPLTDAELQDKFIDLATAVFDDAAVKAAWQELESIDSAASTVELSRLLAG
jgi:2-methylcitrate dehydratase PrpD